MSFGNGFFAGIVGTLAKKHRLLVPLGTLCLLSSCGSITLPAAVRMENGEALTGTTTASNSGGTFQVTSATSKLSCSGNYDPYDTAPVISVPVRCSDGRYGTVTVLRSNEGRSGVGTVSLADGSTGKVAFGSSAAAVLHTSPSPAMSSLASEHSAIYGASSNEPSPGYASTSSSSSIYSGNCPTPDSYDAAGRRCGARSAASRPGGAGSWASSSYGGGSTYVRGYFRKNGTYVRGHTRRR